MTSLCCSWYNALWLNAMHSGEKWWIWDSFPLLNNIFFFIEKDRNYKTVQQHIFISFSFSGKKRFPPPPPHYARCHFDWKISTASVNHSREKELPPPQNHHNPPPGKLWMLPKPWLCCCLVCRKNQIKLFIRTTCMYLPHSPPLKGLT